MIDPAPRRVVIAEDEALIRMDLKELLQEAGYVVVGEAGDGETAVRLAEELRPDLVVLDVKMPVLDGISAAERITEARLAPVLVLTAFSQRDLVERARDAGAMAYVVKPFQASDLVPAIEMAVVRYAERVALENEVADLDRPAGDPQAGGPGQVGPADRARHDRGAGLPLDPEGVHGSASQHASGGGGGARRGHRRP